MDESERGRSMDEQTTFLFRAINCCRFSMAPHGAMPMHTTRSPRRLGDRSDFNMAPMRLLIPVLIPSVNIQASVIKATSAYFKLNKFVV
jgi:hypothetical protein